MPEPADDKPICDNRSWRRFAEWEVSALVVLVAATYLTRLTVAPICGEESRWATAAREMIASGDWIVPRQQTAVFPERPPLGSWAMAVVGLARGHVDLLAVRLPSALATLALVLIIYAYARSWTSRLASFAAAAIYATLGQVLMLGRFGETEAVFTLFGGGSLLVWHWGYLSGRAASLVWPAAYALAALGALAKGLQAPVYLVLATGAYLVARRDWRFLFSRGHALGIICFGTLVGIWFVPFAVNHWWAVDDIWAGLAQDRFTSEGFVRHLWSYPLETFACLLPWSPLLLSLLKPSVRRALAAKHPQAWFLIVALAVTYPSVWLAAAARGRYYMPLYPCLAVLMGLVVEHCADWASSRDDRRAWRLFLRGAALASVVSAAVLVAAGTSHFEQLAPARQPAAFLTFWIVAAVVAASLLLWSSLDERGARPRIALATVATLTALAYTGAVLNSRASGSNDLAPAIGTIKQQLAAGELVSLGRVYHRFAYAYDTPIRQVPWPLSSDELPQDVTYFCFDRRPGDTDALRAASDDRTPLTTPGKLPFEWEVVAEIPCDPAQRSVHHRTVVVGKVRRENLATQGQTNPSQALGTARQEVGKASQEVAKQPAVNPPARR